MFSKACTYALKIMIYLISRETEEDERIGLGEIAEAIDSPKAFTAKVLQQLTRARLLESTRGPHGGFAVPNKRTIHLADVVVAIDGDSLLKGCVLGFEECSAKKPCPVHYKFIGIRDHLAAMMAKTDLEEMKMVMHSGKFRLKE